MCSLKNLDLDCFIEKIEVEQTIERECPVVSPMQTLKPKTRYGGSCGAVCEGTWERHEKQNQVGII